MDTGNATLFLGVTAAFFATLYWITTPRGDNRENTEDGDAPNVTRDIFPFGPAYGIAASVTGLLAFGIMLLPNSNIYQKVSVSNTELSQLRDQIESSLDGDFSNRRLGDLTGQIFVKRHPNDTASVVYVKKISDTEYSLRTVMVDSNNRVIGGVGPAGSLPFFIQDPGSLSRIIPNPEAEDALEEQAALMASVDGSHAVTDAAAVRMAAAQGHDVSIE